MTVQAYRGGKNQIKGVLNGEHDNHPPRNKFRFDLIRDPQRREKTHNTALYTVSREQY